MDYMANNCPKENRIGLVVFLLGLFCLVPSARYATVQASPFGDDDLEVRRAAEVSINYDQQLDFGQLADNDGVVILGLSDSIISDPDHIFYGGSPYSGIFTITGDPDTLVDVSISPNINNDGFTLSSFFSNEGNIPLAGVILDSGGELVLTVGATLTLDKTRAVVGSGQTIAFTITSTYN